MTDSSQVQSEEMVPLAVELSVSNLKTSLELYQALGFKLTRLHEEAKFAVLEFRGAILMLEEHIQEKPLGLGVNLRFYLPNGLSELYALAQSKPGLITQSLLHTSYGLDEFYITDPDGYRIRFCS